MQSMWWFIAAAALGVVEMFTLDLTLLMLAGGAIAGGVVVLAGGSVVLAFIVAAVVSMLLLFALRPWLLRSKRKRGVQFVETNAAALVGANAVAIDDVSNTRGRVKLRGEVWTARVESGASWINEGAEVVVVKIDGATAIVAPVKEHLS
jgi:membrane protein implicated in regulation of membrane protease activity